MHAGVIIDLTGGSLHEDSSKAEHAAMISASAVDSTRVKAWLIAVLLTWQAEAIAIVLAQLWTRALVCLKTLCSFVLTIVHLLALS